MLRCPIFTDLKIICKLNHKSYSHVHPGVQEDVYGLFPTTPSQLPFIDPDSQSPSNTTQTLAQKPGSWAILQMFREEILWYFHFSTDPKKFAPMMWVICPGLSSHPPRPGSRPDSAQCQMLPRLMSVAPGSRRWLWPQNSGCHDYVDGLPGSFSIPDLKRFPSITELIIVLWISTVYNECQTFQKSNSQES